MSRLRVTLLGGVNEIGGNKFLLEEGDRRILLDFGTSIGARNEFFEMPFLQPRTNSALRDLLRLGLLPDLDGVYRDDLLTVARSATDRDLPESADAWRARHGRAGVDAVLVTHAHVDHFQDLAFLDPDVPVWCTPTTKRMICAIEDVKGADVEGEIRRVRRRRVARTGPKSTFPDRATVELEDCARRLEEIEELRPTAIAGFEVTAVPVDHSVPGGCAFVVRTPGGRTVLYTGDVRFHGRLTSRTDALLKAVEGLEPDVMLCEGTRMGSDAADSEADVERGVADLARETEGLVITEFGWKDTTRFDTLQRVAEASGRTLLVDPRLAWLLHALEDRGDVPSGRVEDYRNVEVYRRRKGSMLGEPADYEKHECGYAVDWGDRSTEMKRAWAAQDEGFLGKALAHWRGGVTADDVRAAPERYMVHLTFFGSAELFDLDPPRNSRWIRCSTEPYSDEMAFDLRRQRRWLEQFGLWHNVPERKGDDPGELRARGVVTHVSGHGGGPDLERLVRAAKPKVLVPVHTDEASLQRFEDLRFDTRTFRGRRWRDAGKGNCVVEV